MHADNAMRLSATRKPTASGSIVEAKGGAFFYRFLLVFMQTVLVFLLLCGIYFALPWLHAAFNKPIARILVRGDLQALNQKAVMDVVAIYEEDSFFDVDLAALVHRLESQPWIAHARARRRWPDAVEIDLVEQKPIAYWGNNAIVNAKGRIFEHQGLYQNHALPRLWSELGTPAEAMSHYEIFTQQLQPLALGLRSISQNVQGDWQLQLSNGITVMLDRADPVGNVRNFISVYRQLLLHSARRALVVDMRYRHGAAIRWQPV